MPENHTKINIKMFTIPPNPKILILKIQNKTQYQKIYIHKINQKNLTIPSKIFFTHYIIYKHKQIQQFYQYQAQDKTAQMQPNNIAKYNQQNQMGCAEYKSTNNMAQSPTKQSKEQIESKNAITTSKTLDKSQNPQNQYDSNGSKRQDLSVSDYEAFIQKSKEQGRTDYPAAFKFVKINPLSDAQIDKLNKQDINPLNCTRSQLVKLSTCLVMQNSFSKSNLKVNNVEALITEIAHNYNSVSYHNLSHGVSLMQVCLVLAQMIYKCFKMDETLRKTYTDEELTYYLLAGITHDVNHKGTNNLYEVKLKTELAKTAQDDAVLEKMHLSTFLAICKSKPEYDVISKSSNPQATKEKITRAILATDMGKHFKKLQNLKKKRQEGKLNLKEDQSKIQFMQSLFHGCDISNGLQPIDEFMVWGSILTYQFNQQTKLQAKNNVPVTDFLKFKGMNQYFDGQVGFLNTFVLPLWREINVTLPGVGKLVKNCQNNVVALKQLKQKEQK